MEKLEDLKNREGIFGWISAALDGALEKETKIEETIRDPSKFDVVVLGTPNWGNKMAPAVRTYISKNKHHFKKVALFCTSGGTHYREIIKNMEIACGKSPICVYGSTSHDVKHDNHLERLKEFCDAILATEVKEKKHEKAKQKKVLNTKKKNSKKKKR